MRTHEDIDQRSLRLAEAVVAKIESAAEVDWLARARQVCRRWLEQQPSPVVREWLDILDRPWPEVRKILLDDFEEGRRLRQSDPFCGVLTPQERWQVYRQETPRTTSGS